MTKEKQNNAGITLIALIVTVIVMVILAGVVFYFAIGKEGIWTKGKESAQIYDEQEATEKINLKITNAQMGTYIKEQRMPTLQELAERFREDDEIEYVNLKTKEMASLEENNIKEPEFLLTKLKQYPYEFEINSSLQLASINGVTVGSNVEYVSKQEYDALVSEVQELKEKVKDSNYSLNRYVKVAEITKSKSTAGGTYYFTTTNDLISKTWEEQYFDYNEEKGLIAKKAGVYTIECVGHTSSTSTGSVEIVLLINEELHYVAGRWNSSNCTGRIAGTITVYFNEGDAISGYYIAPNGSNHEYSFKIYSFQ